MCAFVMLLVIPLTVTDQFIDVSASFRVNVAVPLPA